MSKLQLDEEAIFQSAREIEDRAARARYLDQACDQDEKLRRRVEWLLEAEEKQDGFLKSVGGGIPTTSPTAEPLGQQIGPYKLLEQIGEGGMGLVYMAEQLRPVRRLVALKIVKPGMDTKQVIARFEAERQALALMDHPNIARVLDAGTTEAGRPYFVMDLVRGVPINEFCDQKRLSLHERLKLLIQVCHAVQHAHQKGVIHRDLKPTNVLVTLHDSVAVPKVIDFGIAKALGQSLTEHTLHTGFAQLVGTPLYMSPEQAEMNQLGVDTRSDVYSLGVMLYELITGTTPFDKDRLKSAGFDEMRRIIREEEPDTVSARLAKTKSSRQTPSAVASDGTRSVPTTYNELDWIVMKSLEKDRADRYESASALAADIQRFLSDEPVLACPPTTMYRFQKFARKHRAALVTAAAIAICLFLGTTVSAWQAVRAATAETQAQANEQKALANETKANANAAQAQAKAQEATEQRDEAQKQRDEVRALHEKQQATQARLERTLYAAHMNLAQHAWDAGAASRVTDLLDQHRPQAGATDLRGFEWRYLDRLGQSELLTFKGHDKVIWSVTFSPDGKRLASAAYGTVKVWDAETGRELHSLPGRTDPWNRIVRITFAADGRRLASAGPEQTVKVWDAESGAELLSVKSAGEVTGISFSPDGKRLAHAAGQEVHVVDATSGESLLTLKGHATIIGGVSFSPDGRQLASVGRKHVGKSIPGQLKIWDAFTGRELFSLPGPSDSWDIPVVFSSDGRKLASQTGEEAKIWDPKTGTELKTMPSRRGGRIMGLAFSPDGKRLAVSTFDGFVRVWDTERGEEFFVLKGRGPGRTAQDVAYSPDGARLAVTGNMQIKIWDGRSPQEFRSVQESQATTVYPARLTAVFSPDGKRLVGASGNDVKVWDAQTRHELLSLSGHTMPVRCVAFSPDGKLLASGTGTSYNDGYRESEVRIWDSRSGEVRHTLKEPRGGEIEAVVFSPDSQQVAAAFHRNMVRIWSTESGMELRTLRHQRDAGWIHDLAYSPDGKRIATASYNDGTIKIWDTGNGQELATLKTKQYAGSALAIAFTSDGKRLASGHGGPPIRIWNAETGEELMLLKGHAAHVNCVSFSPDGKRLASGSGDRTVKIWDTETGDELLSLSGHPVMLAGVAFSPDGNLLATTGQDETVRVWDATPLSEKP